MFNIVSFHELQAVKVAADERIERLEARILLLESTLANVEAWANHLKTTLRGI